MRTRLVRVFLLLGLMFGLCPVLTVPSVLAQIDPDVRDRVLPAVVEIAFIIDVDEGGTRSKQFVPVGSGTIVAPDGLILTNWHVVDMADHRAELDRWEAEARENGEKLSFVLNDVEVLVLQTEGIGKPVPAYRAEVIAEHHALDLAVLHITSDADGVPVVAEDLNLPFVRVGASHDVRQGDPVHVFGYPAIGGGTLQYTTGVVSGFGFDPGIDGAVWITTDASVSGGSSGGAAVNAAGELIGVPTQGGQLDCRPGDTNGDGEITADDVGCIPTGGSIGQLRPIDLAKPMLASAGLTLEAASVEDQQAPIAAVDPSPTPAPTPTPVPSPTSPPQPNPTPASDEVTTASSDVSMYRANPQRTGEMPGPAPEGELGVLWEVDLGYGMYGQPALVDGVVYVVAGIEFGQGGIAAAFDAATGEEIWLRRQNASWSSPTLANGKVYYTGLYGTIASLNSVDGTQIQHRVIKDKDWGCNSGSSPLATGKLIVASFGCFGPEDTDDVTPWTDLTGQFIGFDENLNELWRFTYLGFSPFVSPAFSDGVIYIADSQAADAKGTVYAVNAETGQELWRFDANGGFAFTPMIVRDLVIATSFNGKVYALEADTGLERWRFDMGPWTGLGPTVLGQNLYVGDGAGRIYAIDISSGQRVDHLQGYSTYTDLASHLGSLFVGGKCGYIFIIELDPPKRESVKAVATCTQVSSPIVVDGFVVAGTEDGRLVALADLRVSVPIAEGLRVLIADEAVSIRAAPSSVAIVRGEATSGRAATVTGPSEEREGMTWWPVDVDGIGLGWVQESALIAAEVPPTPTPMPTATPRPTVTPVPTPSPEPTPTPEALVASTEPVVTLFDIYFEPRQLVIAANQDVHILLPNDGVTLHSFVIDELGVAIEIQPGESAEVVINAPPGEYEYLCDIPGHAAAGMVGALLVISEDSDKVSTSDDEDVMAVAVAEAIATAEAELASESKIVSYDIYFDPKAISIPAHTDVNISLPNEGVTLHNFAIDEFGINVDIPPGETKEVVINAPAGTYEYYCDIPGHKAAGMVGTLTIE
jgi:outer membrane protein assembly factor BamB/S1-C subfamily serine protease/plastocyanin